MGKSPNHTATTIEQQICYHCGVPVLTNVSIHFDDKDFCCVGCQTVYQVLNKHQMCAYYQHNKNPGNTQKNEIRPGKFSFLDQAEIRKNFIQFSNSEFSQVNFYLPQMHCSSCLWLLENLPKINSAVITSRVNFSVREIVIQFQEDRLSLKQLAELLTSIGYEPHLSLNHLEGSSNKALDRGHVYKIAVAGFCFGNIMMMSFPAYFGLETVNESLDLSQVFRFGCLALSLPVFFYAASGFFLAGFQGLKQRLLTIDAPIALAILITFLRSIYEILSNTGPGYLDSMSGIVFFMLVGRWMQNRTQQSLSFKRDYSSYFPIAVSKWENNTETPVTLPNLKAGDTIIIYNQEIIPADSLLVRGHANIDYSFVTGESMPVPASISELVYAGGRQMGEKIELLLVKDVSQSYLTNLWNQESMKDTPRPVYTWVQPAAKYFTWVLFTLTALAALYWWQFNPEKMWSAVTSALIVACPCALLLSQSFTNGHILAAYDRIGLYLKNASVIEQLTRIHQIVFDKTGTLTKGQDFLVEAVGKPPSGEARQMIASLAAQSAHPLSTALVAWLNEQPLALQAVKEVPGAGVEGWINDCYVKLGSLQFVFGRSEKKIPHTVVAWSIDQKEHGMFLFKSHFRNGLSEMLSRLNRRFKLSVLTGDNAAAHQQLSHLFNAEAQMLYHQSPTDKLNFIIEAQKLGKNLLMVGDGLNDAGALQAATVGIAVTENTNNFSPGCDGILVASQLPQLDGVLWLARFGKKVMVASFALSIVYNLVGLFYAFQAKLSPLLAAILMPSSTITIILFTWLSIQWASKKMQRHRV